QSGARDGAAGGRGPAGRQAGQQGLRRAQREGPLPRRYLPRRDDRQERLLARSEGGLRVGAHRPLGCGGQAGRPVGRGGRRLGIRRGSRAPGDLRPGRRGLPAAAQDPARRSLRTLRRRPAGRGCPACSGHRPEAAWGEARRRGSRGACPGQSRQSGGAVSTQRTGHEPGDTPRIIAAATPHAKAHLHLRVRDVRPGGAPELDTIFPSVRLQETVTLTAVPRGEEPALTVSGPDAHLVPRDPSNLAWRAVEIVRDLSCERAGLLEHPAADPATRAPSVSIHIDKNVPVAGGMAGGSADAAAALVAAVEFYFGRQPLPYPTPRKAVAPSQAELLALAGILGADVPFCVLGGTALGTARGDELISIMS